MLARGETERTAFLEQACEGNEALRREVEALLRYDGVDRFIDAPALLIAADGFGQAPVQSSFADMTGQQFGVYAIGSLIDSGGMGGVHCRARFTSPARRRRQDSSS